MEKLKDKDTVKLKIKNNFIKESFVCNTHCSAPITVNAFKVLNEHDEALEIFTSLDKKLYKNGRYVSSKKLTNYLQKYNNKDSSSAKHLIMFSGGYDSLSLTLRYLEKGESVMLFSLIFDPEMTPFVALQGLILNHIYPGLVKGIHFLGNEQFADPCVEHMNGMVQQPFTAFFAGRIKNEILEKAETFDCAYCMNDDALSFEEELKTIYETHIKSRICNPSKFPKLTFPLRKTKHINNVEYVNNVQAQKSVIFPVSSIESIDLSINFYVVKSSLYMLMRKTSEASLYKDNKEGGFDFGGYIFRLDNVDIKEEDLLEKIGLGAYCADDVERKKRKIKAKKVISDIRKYSILTSEEILEALKTGETESKKLEREDIKDCKKLETSISSVDVVEK